MSASGLKVCALGIRDDTRSGATTIECGGGGLDSGVPAGWSLFDLV